MGFNFRWLFYFFLWGFAAALSLGVSAYKPFLVAIQIVVITRLVICLLSRQISINLYVLIALSIPLILLACNLPAPEEMIRRYDVKNLIASMYILVGMWMLPVKLNPTRVSVFAVGAFLVIAISSMAHLVSETFFSLQSGLYSNPHYLSLQAILSIPVLFYLTQGKRWLAQIILTTVLGIELYLLLTTQSRPAWLGLLVGSLITIPFLSGSQRLKAALAVILIPGALYVAGIAGLDQRMNNLISSILQEERMTIWADSWAMQINSGLFEWLFGHGLGSFRYYFTEFSQYHPVIDYYSPHNFFLELLFNSGLVGLGAVIIGISLFFYALIKHFGITENTSQKRLILLTLCLITAQLFHTFLTVPIFSSYSAYSLAMLIGFGLYLFKRQDYLERKSL